MRGCRARRRHAPHGTREVQTVIACRSFHQDRPLPDRKRGACWMLLPALRQKAIGEFYARRTLFMTTGVFGTFSCPIALPVATLAIASTTSMPSVTLPNTQYPKPASVFAL